MNTQSKSRNLNRREAVLALGVTAVTLASLATGHAAGLETGHSAHMGHADLCAKACADCVLECAKHLGHCTEQLVAGKSDYAKCLQLCVGCADICGTCARTCHGPLGRINAEACAKACDECATECEKFLSDEAMKGCAKVCRDCAKACREFIKTAE